MSLAARLLLLMAAGIQLQGCHDDRPDSHDAAAPNDRPDATLPEDHSDGSVPYDQPDGPGRTPCNLDKSPLCPGTQVCVLTCEYGAVAQYCRDPDAAGLALGEKCTQQKYNCQKGGCMQEPRSSDGPYCTAFCVVDTDCPTDTHCVASNFSYSCPTGRQSFQEGLCRALSVQNPSPP